MKLLILTAIVATVAASPVAPGQTWPWEVGKVYYYNVNSMTSTKFEYGIQNGHAIMISLIVSVKTAGHLQGKIEDPVYSSTKTDKPMNFQPIQSINQTFDIFVDGGRIISMNFPSSLSVVHENLIKSFISALQVDVSTFRYVLEYPNSYDHESFQGLFKKLEADLTGECETLYSISPMSAEWRQELRQFSSEEDPIEITKTKNYGACSKLIAYEFGVPEGAVWKGVAQGNEDKQFIKHTSNARILVGKQGTIYKSEITSSVLVSPLVYGKQKVEVNTIVTASLRSVKQEITADWQTSKDFRSVNSLLFTVDNSWRLFTYGGEQNVAKAQQVLQEISPLLQNSSQLQKGDFLMQFNVLVYILMSMNSEQLTQMTTSVEVARTSKNISKNGVWIIYRDAVAACGTARAFNEIKSWVMTKKIEGEEAAQVITSFSQTLHNYSNAVLTDFFNFTTCPEVLEQKSLNNSALLAVSKLLRTSKDDKFIVETVIPRFSKDLKHAIYNGETSKAQVYVRVLGNLAHPGILKAFAPYLEGHVTVTKYLRTQMVTSLKTLANLKDKYVRSVLFSILKNTAEPYEVRVAAALNIFLAFPSDEMLQVMARMTNYDPSTQVRAVLATSITFAAGLKEPRFAEVAHSAKSVLHIITKEKYGYSYSTDSLIDWYTSDEDFSFFRELSYIGSDNTLLPKYYRAAMRFMDTGYGDERQVTLSISDVQDLINNFISMILEPSKVEPTFKFSAKQIVEMLNIKRAPRQPLEGALFVEHLNQQKLFTFNEEELFVFFKNIIDNINQIMTSGEVHYTKILRHNQIYVDFPIANGMAFTYQYSEPMIINAHGEIKLLLAKSARSGFLESKTDVTYARNILSNVGYMDTIGEILVGAGVINKLQVHIPTKIKTTVKIKREFIVDFELLQPDEDTNLVYMSIIPYSSTQKKDSITYNLDVMLPRKEPVRTGNLLSPLTGMYFSFYGKTYSSDYVKNYNEDDNKNEDDYVNMEKLFKVDFFTNLKNLLYQKDIAWTQYDLTYRGTYMESKSVTFTFHLDKLYHQNNIGEMGPATLNQHLNPKGADRREEIVKTVSAGIDLADVWLIDVSAVFNRPHKIYEYVFTAAYAESFIDPKIQAAFIVYPLIGFLKISAVFKLNSQGAKIVPLNFKEALKNNVNVTYDAVIKAEDLMDLYVQGYGERSNEYTELLKNDPTGKSCLADVSNNNLYQKDCHKMIIKAHTPDYFKTSVTLNSSAPLFWVLVDNAYQNLKGKYFWNKKMNPYIEYIKQNEAVIEAQSFYFDNYSNYNITTKFGLFNFNNVEDSGYKAYATAIYAPITAWERYCNWYTGYQYMPYCAVDDNKVSTFSGRSYDYKLTSSWHVVMVDESNGAGKFDDLLILARRPNVNEEIVYVSYKTQSGKYIELEIKPNNVEVKTNSVKTYEGALTVYWDRSDKDFEKPLLEYYTLAKGVQVFNIGDRHLRLVYDNHRLVIFTDDHRSTTRGLCGQSTGQTSDDYMTPWGLVSLSEHYGASFSLEGEFSDPKTVQLKKEAKQKAYQPVAKLTRISDASWSNRIE